jgi:centrin-1
MTTKISDKNSKAQYQKVFNMYDDGKNGYITVDNLARVANELGESVSAE